MSTIEAGALSTVLPHTQLRLIVHRAHRIADDLGRRPDGPHRFWDQRRSKHTYGYTTSRAGHNLQVGDADGNLTSVTDPGGNVTTYGYDSLDRMVSQTTPATGADPSGITTTYTLDGDGNTTAAAQPGTSGSTLTTTYGYNANNQPTSISYSDGTTHGATYSYTPEGERASMTDATGTSHYSYNRAGWLTTTTDGGGHAVGYGYDLDGNATTVTYPNGQSVNRSFDADDSSSIADTTSTATIASSVLARDADDELTGVTTSGTLVGPSTTYGYNQLGQLTTYKVGTAAATNYGYDSDDNLATLPGGTSQSFDAAHEMTHTGTAAVTSDTRGNLSTQVPTSGTASYFAYDQANRVTNYYSTAGYYATYVYNGDGLRTSKTVNGTTNPYTWDTSADTPLLLSDGTNSYIYGPDDLPIEQITTAGTPTYLQHDQQGSTTLLTNSAGTPVAVYVYTPYGTTSIFAGTVATPLRYDGQYQDNESGLYYLRARYYNPATGQFITRDPLEAQTHQPYEYASNTPLDGGDPSGLCWTHVACGTVDAVDNTLSGGASWAENEVDNHWRGIAQGAAAVGTAVAISACVGATAGVCGGVVATYAVTAGIGAASGAAGYALSGGAHSLDGYVQNAAWGGITGLAGGMCSVAAVGVCSGAWGRAVVPVLLGAGGGAMADTATAAATGCNPSGRELTGAGLYGAVAGLGFEFK